MKKRMLALALALVMMVALLPTTASAASITESEVTSKLTNLMNGTYKTGTQYTGSGECFGFAVAVFNAVFGTSLSAKGYSNAYFSYDTSAYLTEVGHLTNFTQAQLANLLKNARRGDMLLLADSGKSYGHVMIIWSVSSSGVPTVYDANASTQNKNYGFSNAIGCHEYTLGTAIYHNGAATLYRYKNYASASSTTSSSTSTTSTAQTTITFQNLSVPSTLTEGSDGSLDGSVTSTNSKINSVKAEVCDASTGSVKLTASSSGNFSVWTYGPLTNSKLNTDLDLGKLSPGTYYVKYTVGTQDGTSATKSTSNFTVKVKACTTHAWGNWTTTKAATCTATGSRTHSCTKCGNSESEPISPLGHNYKLTGSTPTRDTYTCSNCGDSYTKEKEPDCSNGHTWSEWTTVTPATCTSNGLEQHICELCGFVQKSDIPMLGHNYQAMQETDAYIRYTCANCKDSYTVDKDPICETVGHTWGEWTVTRPATCTSAGRQEHTCTVCGKTESELLAYLHHNYELTHSTSTQDVYTCSLCGDSYTESKEISATIDDADYFDTSTAHSSGMANFVTSYYYYNGLFSDVSYLDWFYPNVDTAYSLGLMKGTGDSVFSPRNNMTIAEVITLAARIHSIYHTGSDSFTSYDGGNWYDPYVNYARANGIISENYNYTRPATREQVVHILSKALPEEELQNTAGYISFADSADITYALDVQLLSGAGVINGIKLDQVYFMPLAAITRAEVAAIVGRMVQPDTRIGR